MKFKTGLITLLLVGEVMAGTLQGMAFLKEQPQKQDKEKEQEEQRMSNSEKKAWNMGWEKDQRPFIPIKTKPNKRKKHDN
jgi:hypothetical protein